MFMKFKTKIVLYNSYFDANNNLSLKGVLGIFQDVASIHAEEIGVGYETMLEKNLFWVISRIKIDIFKMPTINQTVVVETWPHEKVRAEFDRDLKILSESGEVLVVGTSKWCVINTKTRFLQRADDVVYNGEVYPQKNYAEKFEKIKLPTGQPVAKFSYTVLFSDLDHNGHMNNTNYANLVVSALDCKKFTHFQINFLSECKLNDVILVSLIKDNSGEYVVGTVNSKPAFVTFVN